MVHVYVNNHFQLWQGYYICTTREFRDEFHVPRIFISRRFEDIIFWFVIGHPRPIFDGLNFIFFVMVCLIIYFLSRKVISVCEKSLVRTPAGSDQDFKWYCEMKAIGVIWIRPYNRCPMSTQVLHDKVHSMGQTFCHFEYSWGNLDISGTFIKLPDRYSRK